MSQVHARARTTPLIRTEIRESELGVVALAEHYNITRGTASKWKNREDVQDRSHRPHKLSTTLSEGQEALVRGASLDADSAGRPLGGGA